MAISCPVPVQVFGPHPALIHDPPPPPPTPHPYCYSRSMSKKRLNQPCNACLSIYFIAAKSCRIAPTGGIKDLSAWFSLKKIKSTPRRPQITKRYGPTYARDVCVFVLSDIRPDIQISLIELGGG